MIFTSVEVRNFGVIRGPLKLSLRPGLNVIHGPNESGKSTLVRALWAALTLRHRVGGEERKAMVPRTGGVPEVEVGFAHQGAQYTVTKRFAGQRGAAQLRVQYEDGRPIEDLRDEDAEIRLRGLLGLTPGTDGKKDEDLGYLPLIWVRQERSALLPTAELHKGAREALSEQLGRLSGELLGGPEAEQLVDLAGGEMARFFTAKTTRLRSDADSPFAPVDRRLREAEALTEALQSRKQDHDALLDRQEAVSLRLLDLADRLPAAERARQHASERAEALRALRAQVESARAAARLAESNQQNASRRWSERCDLRSRLSEARAEAEAAQKAVLEAGLAHGHHSDHRDRRVHAVQTAELEEGRRKRLRERLDLHVEALRQRAELSRLERELARARELEATHREATERLAQTRIDDAGAARIQELHDRLVRSEATLEAAITRVEVRALAEVALTVDGRPVALGPKQRWSWEADGPVTLRISELVEVEIAPGATDLDSLRDKVGRARHALSVALQEAGVASVAEARLAAEQLRSLRPQVERLSRQLAELGAGGSGALARRHEAAAGNLARVERNRDLTHREGDPPLPVDLVPAQTAKADAETALAEARAEVQKARDDLSRFDRDAVSLQGAHRRAEELNSLAQKRLGQLASGLATHAEGAPDEALKRARDEAGAALAREREALQGMEAALQAMNPAEVEAQMAAAERDFNALRHERDSLEREAARIQGELGAADLIGLHDRLAAAVAELERAREDRAALLEQAEAARLLYETLSSARDTARERYMGPLRSETERLLRLVFPEASLGFDDQFNLTQISRSEADAFDVLSVGTREQVGVIVRLAMAGVLAGGEPLPVILDDALVSTDEARFLRMMPVFTDVAKHLQILMLTCHWSRYHAVGGVADQVLDLEALKRGTV